MSRDVCATGDGQPIDDRSPEWMLCTGCLDYAASLADERTQAAGYRDGLDVKPATGLPEFSLRRI